MAESLVIEWDRDELIAATGSASGSQVTLRKVVVTKRNEGQNLSPEELGDELRKSLTNGGIVADSAIVVFPRSLVTFRRIELPHVPDAEVPDMVRLQAATRLTVPVDSVCLDFVPLPIVAGSETRDVLLVTLPKKHVEQVQKTLSTCGIELAGVRVSTFGVAASFVYSGLVPATNAHTVEALVWLRSDLIEMIFMKGQSVIFSHSGASWQSTDRIEQAVKAEVSRARMAAAEDIGDYTVSRITLIGSNDITAAVPDSISQRLNDAEVRRIDADNLLLNAPLVDGQTPSDLLAIAGIIANVQIHSVESVDLVNPRKPPVKKDNRRLKAIVSTGAAVLLLTGGWTWRQSTVDGLETKRNAIASDATRLSNAYKAGGDDIDLDKKLLDWQQRDHNWLAEMQKIQQLLGSTETVLIKELDFAAGQGQTAGTVTATGAAASRNDVEDLMRVFRESGYEVVGSYIPSSREPGYNQQMTLELKIPVAKPDRKKGGDKT